MEHPAQPVRFPVQPQSRRPLRRMRRHYREQPRFRERQLQMQRLRSLEFPMLCQVPRELLREAPQGFRVVRALLRTRSRSREHLVSRRRKWRST